MSLSTKELNEMNNHIDLPYHTEVANCKACYRERVLGYDIELLMLELARYIHALKTIQGHAIADKDSVVIDNKPDIYGRLQPLHMYIDEVLNE